MRFINLTQKKIKRTKTILVLLQKKIPHKFKLYLCFIPMLFLGFGVTAHSSNGASHWLQFMSKATKNNSYTQTFVYETQSLIDTISMKHAYINGHEYEALQFLTGSKRELFRKDDVFYTKRGVIDAEKKVQSYKTSITSTFEKEALGKLSSLYHINVSANHRTAGRDCIKLAITPKDQLSRYSHSIWIDKDTGIMLRNESFNEKGELLERFLTTNFVPNEKHSLKTFALDGVDITQKYVAKEHLSEPNGTEGQTELSWHFSWLPTGFTMTKSGKLNSPVNDQSTQYAFFTDGIVSYSVYLEKETSQFVHQSIHIEGMSTIVAKVFKTSDNSNYHVTVMGELPKGILERVASSIQKKNPQIQSKV